VDHQDWLVVTLDPELWLEFELAFDELLVPDLLDDEPLDVDESSLDDVELLDVDESSSDEVEVEESSDEVELLDVVVAVESSSLAALACCEALLVDVLPRFPVAEIVPNAITKVASAAAATRRRIMRARRARAFKRSRTRSEVEVGGWF
jgi:hypothetical protein